MVCDAQWMVKRTGRYTDTISYLTNSGRGYTFLLSVSPLWMTTITFDYSTNRNSRLCGIHLAAGAS
jgi:hypothetical protein